MPEPKIRKLLTVVAEIYHEGGRPVEKPPLRAAVLAVIGIPFAGACHDEIAGVIRIWSRSV